MIKILNKRQKTVMKNETIPPWNCKTQGDCLLEDNGFIIFAISNAAEVQEPLDSETRKIEKATYIWST